MGGLLDSGVRRNDVGVWDALGFRVGSGEVCWIPAFAGMSAGAFRGIRLLMRGLLDSGVCRDDGGVWDALGFGVGGGAVCWIPAFGGMMAGASTVSDI